MKRVVLDPVFASTAYRCCYCDADLLADLGTFLSKVRDHLVPRSAGGPNASANRVPSCAACDRLKGSRQFTSVEEAREFLSTARAGWGLWLDGIRAVLSR